MELGTSVKLLVEKMERSVSALQLRFNNIRANSISSDLIRSLTVILSDKRKVKLQDLASVTRIDIRTIMIKASYKENTNSIKSALDACPGLNSVIRSDAIIVNAPMMTSEKRKELQKLSKQEGEKTKVIIRSYRREAINSMKGEKGASRSSIKDRKTLQELQDQTDRCIGLVQSLIASKQKELS